MKEREIESDNETERERESERASPRERERERERQKETERDRERQRETERDRERQRETERDREREITRSILGLIPFSIEISGVFGFVGSVPFKTDLKSLGLLVGIQC